MDTPLAVAADRIRTPARWLVALGAPLTTGWARAIGVGLLTVLVTLGVLASVLATIGWVELAPLGGIDNLAGALAWVALLGVRVVAEELVFRGALSGRLTIVLPTWPAIAVQGIAFGGWTALVEASANGLVGAILLGTFLGLVRHTTGTVWAGIGIALGSVVGAQVLTAMQLEVVAGPQALVSFLLGIAPLLVVFLVVRRVGSTWTIHDWMPDLPPPGRRRTTSANAGGPEGLGQRGVMYDVGVSYAPGQSSRERWDPEVVRRELRVIRDELHADAVLVIGMDVARLDECAATALDLGLFVWIQPRVVDASADDVIAHLTAVARVAQRRHTDAPGRVGLNVGCELSVFSSGILPGDDMGERAHALETGQAARPGVHGRLNELLDRAVTAARSEFDGPLSYGAGSWERVDWEPFDVVGLDHYLDDSTRSTYVAQLRRHRRAGKPVVVFEFGCCSYEGAERLGGGGGWNQDWSDLDDRRLDGDYVRDEQVQATYLGKLIDVLDAEAIDGAFVCMFIEADHPTSSDPRRDLDMASLGIVKAHAAETGLRGDEGHWRPKLAFHEVARRYEALAARQGPFAGDAPLRRSGPGGPGSRRG